MTIKRLFIPALFLVFLVGTMQIAYAEPQGQPFQDLQNEIEELKASVAALEEKDIELMDADAAEAAARDAKDMLLMTANGNLGSDLAAVQADADISCATIPVVKTGFGLVTGSTVIALDAFNVGIGVFNVGLSVFNTALMKALVAFNVGIAVTNGLSGNFNSVVDTFNSALDTTISLLNTVIFYFLAAVNVFDVFNVIPEPGFGTFSVIPDIPDIPDVPAIPLAGMSSVPALATIDTTLIDAADDAVQSLALCT